jgi:hypothetical protein
MICIVDVEDSETLQSQRLSALIREQLGDRHISALFDIGKSYEDDD